MKFLIVIVAVLALGQADDDTWETCKPKVEAMKACLSKKSDAVGKDLKEKATKFMEDAKTCFNLDTTKDKCVLDLTAPAASPCIQEAKTNFSQCMKTNLSLPDSFNMTAEMEKYEGEHHGFGRMPSKEELNGMALKFCKGDKDAADALMKCGKEKFEAFAKSNPMPSMSNFADPMKSMCEQKKACETEAPLSEGCGKLVVKGIQAFCSCSKAGKESFKTSSTCTSDRETLKASFGQSSTSGSSNNDHDMHHDMGHKPDFDICKLDLTKDPCADKTATDANTANAKVASFSAPNANAAKVSGIEKIKSSLAERKQGSGTASASVAASGSASAPLVKVRTDAKVERKP